MDAPEDDASRRPAWPDSPCFIPKGAPRHGGGSLTVRWPRSLFLTVFFAGITAAAFDARVWVIVVAGGALTLWMGTLAVRMLRAAREESAR